MSDIDNENTSSQQQNDEFMCDRPTSPTASDTSSLASIQMAAGLLQIYEPPITKVRNHLKELIAKQNKIYIDLSAEKYKYDSVEIANLQEMMNNIKLYREKLIKIKKQMQAIYQKSKSLKKRSDYIQACKQKELTRKIQKQQQEEALIARRNGNAAASTSTSSPSSFLNR